MKTAGMVDLYREAPSGEPTAAMDAAILAAAREFYPPAQAPFRLLAGAAVAMVIVLIAVRWFAVGGAAASEVSTKDFGLIEGQSRAYLVRPDLKQIVVTTDSGFGSREGL